MSEQQLANILSRFNFALQTQLKPYNELAELFNVYINVTRSIMAAKDEEIAKLKKEQKGNLS
jgi:hypothetical protein